MKNYFLSNMKFHLWKQVLKQDKMLNWHLWPWLGNVFKDKIFLSEKIQN
jgi:hypothetical protein